MASNSISSSSKNFTIGSFSMNNGGFSTINKSKVYDANQDVNKATEELDLGSDNKEVSDTSQQISDAFSIPGLFDINKFKEKLDRIVDLKNEVDRIDVFLSKLNNSLSGTELDEEVIKITNGEFTSYNDLVMYRRNIQRTLDYEKTNRASSELKMEQVQLPSPAADMGMAKDEEDRINGLIGKLTGTLVASYEQAKYQSSSTYVGYGPFMQAAQGNYPIYKRQIDEEVARVTNGEFTSYDDLVAYKNSLVSTHKQNIENRMYLPDYTNDKAYIEIDNSINFYKEWTSLAEEEMKELEKLYDKLPYITKMQYIGNKDVLKSYEKQIESLKNNAPTISYTESFDPIMTPDNYNQYQSNLAQLEQEYEMAKLEINSWRSQLDSKIKELSGGEFETIDDFLANYDSAKQLISGIEAAINGLETEKYTYVYHQMMESAHFKNYVSKYKITEVEKEDEYGINIKRVFCDENGKIIPEYTELGKNLKLTYEASQISKYEEYIKSMLPEKMRHDVDFNFNYYKMYTMLLEEYGEEVANQYIEDMKDEMNCVLGLMHATQFCSSLVNNGGADIANLIPVHFKGIGDGTINSVEGLLAWFSENPDKSEYYYESIWIANFLSTGKFGYLQSGNYELGQSIGNMLPSIALSALNPTLGSIYLGMSSGGNTYRNLVWSGEDPNLARFKGIITGISEVATEKWLGTLPFLSEVKVTSLETWLTAMIREGNQEVLQDLITSILTGEDFTLEQAAKTWLIAALTSGEMNLPGFVSYTVNKNKILAITEENGWLRVVTGEGETAINLDKITEYIKENPKAKLSKLMKNIEKMIAEDNAGGNVGGNIGGRIYTAEHGMQISEDDFSGFLAAKIKQGWFTPEQVQNIVNNINNRGYISESTGRYLENIAKSGETIYIKTVNSADVESIFANGIYCNGTSTSGYGFAPTTTADINLENTVSSVDGVYDLVSGIKGAFGVSQGGNPINGAVIIKVPAGLTIDDMVYYNNEAGCYCIKPEYVTSFIEVDQNGVASEPRFNEIDTVVLQPESSITPTEVITEENIKSLSDEQISEVVKKEQQKFSVKDFYLNESSSGAVCIISGDNSATTENFVMNSIDPTNPVIASHEFTASAIYRALFGRGLPPVGEGQIFQNGIVNDGNICIQICRNGPTAIWVPGTITEYQFQQLVEFNKQIKETYASNPAYFAEHPMEFYFEASDGTAIEVANNLDAIIEKISYDCEIKLGGTVTKIKEETSAFETSKVSDEKIGTITLDKINHHEAIIEKMKQLDAEYGSGFALSALGTFLGITDRNGLDYDFLEYGEILSVFGSEVRGFILSNNIKQLTNFYNQLSQTYINGEYGSSIDLSNLPKRINGYDTASLIRMITNNYFSSSNINTLFHHFEMLARTKGSINGYVNAITTLLLDYAADINLQVDGPVIDFINLINKINYKLPSAFGAYSTLDLVKNIIDDYNSPKEFLSSISARYGNNTGQYITAISNLLTYASNNNIDLSVSKTVIEFINVMNSELSNFAIWDKRNILAKCADGRIRTGIDQHAVASIMIYGSEQLKDQLIELVKKKYPTIRNEEAIKFLMLMEGKEGSQGICNYADVGNKIFGFFVMHPELSFEDFFGFPMFDENGYWNEAMLLADMFVNITGDKLITMNDNGELVAAETNSEYEAVTAPYTISKKTGKVVSFGNRTYRIDLIEAYLKSKGIECTITENRILDSLKTFADPSHTVKIITSEINKALKNNKFLSLTENVGLELMAIGKGVDNDVLDGAHIMSILGINNDGMLLVNSWGRPWIVNLYDAIVSKIEFTIDTFDININVS